MDTQTATAVIIEDGSIPEYIATKTRLHRLDHMLQSMADQSRALAADMAEIRATRKQVARSSVR